MVLEGGHHWEETVIGDYLMVMDSEGEREGGRKGGKEGEREGGRGGENDG